VGTRVMCVVSQWFVNSVQLHCKMDFLVTLVVLLRLVVVGTGRRRRAGRCTSLEHTFCKCVVLLVILCTSLDA
jgi:cytochrome b561